MTDINHWSQSSEWRNQAHSWIHHQLETHKIEQLGEIEQVHIQPWSTILRIPVSEGALFFKAAVALLAHESAVIELLSQIMPEHLPELLALDTSQGWILMRDCGSRLRETMIAEPEFKFWEELLPDFAKLQIAASKLSDKFLAMGIPNRSLENLPQLYENLLAEEVRFRIEQENGLSAEEYQRLHDLKPVFKQKCEQLANYPIPQSLHHGDLHDANIFHNGEHYLFLDWGDCSYSHPFFSMRTAYVSAEIRLDLEEYSPQLHRLRDAYLSGWREFGTAEQLLEAFGLAEELWAVSSMLIWYRSITSLDEASQAEFAHVIPSLSQEFMSLIKS